MKDCKGKMTLPILSRLYREWECGLGVVLQIIEFRVRGLGLRVDVFRMESLNQGRWRQSQVVFVVLVVIPKP